MEKSRRYACRSIDSCSSTTYILRIYNGGSRTRLLRDAGTKLHLLLGDGGDKCDLRFEILRFYANVKTQSTLRYSPWQISGSISRTVRTDGRRLAGTGGSKE